jgi:hypothetical protein
MQENNKASEADQGYTGPPIMDLVRGFWCEGVAAGFTITNAGTQKKLYGA